MDSLITFEERYKVESERRRTKPFSAKMHVRFIKECLYCHECHGLHEWCKAQGDRPFSKVSIFEQAERVIVSYR